MKPVEIPGRADLVYAHPLSRHDPERYKDLKCERVERGVIRSFWKPSDEELAELKDGGVVELVIFGEPIPPVSLVCMSMLEAGEPYADGGDAG